MSAQKSKRTKECHNCLAPVRRTLGNAGYCKRCVRAALVDQETQARQATCDICGRTYTRYSDKDGMCQTCGNALLDSNETLRKRDSMSAS